MADDGKFWVALITAILALAGTVFTAYMARRNRIEQDRFKSATDRAMARLTASPRHGEWVMVQTGPQDSVRAWVVYPERSTPAPVVLVVHEIFGLSNWVRAVADQFAAEGFLAIAPDLLSGHGVPDGPEGADPEAARALAQRKQLRSAGLSAGRFPSRRA